jgi:hypothetical protein
VTVVREVAQVVQADFDEAVGDSTLDHAVAKDAGEEVGEDCDDVKAHELQMGF